MAARERRLLLAQHDVAVLRPVRHEERDEAAARRLLVRAVRIPLGDRGVVEWPARDGCRVLQQAAHRRAGRRRTRHEIAQGLPRPLDSLEIGVARRFGMVGLVETEERPCRLSAGLQRGGRRLDHRTGDFVLEAFARQIGLGVDPACVPIRRAEQLHRIGGEGGGAIEAAVRDPRVQGALGEVLPAHHHRPAARMPGDMVVDVLRHIRLVAHDEAAGAEADVLHEGRIAGQRLRTGVRHLHPPQPEVVTGVQPERDRVSHPCRRALPGEAILRGTEADLRAGSDRLHDHRLRRADPQIQAGDPAVERRAMHLVDQRPPALVLVLDGEHASVRQDADRQARGVRDAAQAEIALARRLEGAEGRHLESLVSCRRRSRLDHRRDRARIGRGNRRIVDGARRAAPPPVPPAAAVNAALSFPAEALGLQQI